MKHLFIYFTPLRLITAINLRVHIYWQLFTPYYAVIGTVYTSFVSAIYQKKHFRMPWGEVFER